MAGKKFNIGHATSFGRNKGFDKEIDKIENLFEILKNPNIKFEDMLNKKSVRKESYIYKIKRGYLIDLFKEKRVLQEFIEKRWAYGKERGGRTHMKHCVDLKNMAERYYKKNPD